MHRLATLAALAAAVLLSAPAAQAEPLFEVVDFALEAEGRCTHLDCWAGFAQCEAQNTEPGAAIKCRAILERCLDRCPASSLATESPVAQPPRPCFMPLPGPTGAVAWVNPFNLAEYRAEGSAVRLFFGGDGFGREYPITLDRFEATLAEACTTSPTAAVRQAVGAFFQDAQLAAAVADAILDPAPVVESSLPPVYGEQGLMIDAAVDVAKWAAANWGDADRAAALTEAVLERLIGEVSTPAERAELARLVGQAVELVFRRLGWRP